MAGSAAVRPSGGTAPRGSIVLATLLAVLSVVPLVVPAARRAATGRHDPGDHRPRHHRADRLGAAARRGRAPVAVSPVEAPGDYALFVDAADTLQAIVLRTDEEPEAAASTMISGHVMAETALVEEVPFEATVFGAPPVVVVDQIIELDPAAKAERVTWWPISILPIVLAVLLVIGARAGYPIFRPTTEIDVLSTPLGPGERLPAAWGGRLGPNERDLGDPGAALLVVRPGPKGNVLTAQPLPDDDGPAPPPVAIGGGWTSGRVGYVYTASETVPALVIQAEDVDATLLFAKTRERDRIASLVAVERG